MTAEVTAMPCGPRFRPFGVEPLRVSPVPASIAIAGRNF